MAADCTNKVVPRSGEETLAHGLHTSFFHPSSVTRPSKTESLQHDQDLTLGPSRFRDSTSSAPVSTTSKPPNSLLYFSAAEHSSAPSSPSPFSRRVPCSIDRPVDAMKATPLIINWHDQNAPVYSAHFEPSGKGRLATAGGDNNVRVWQVDSDGPERKVEYLSTLAKHNQAVNVVRWAPKGRLDRSVIARTC